MKSKYTTNIIIAVANQVNIIYPICDLDGETKSRIIEKHIEEMAIELENACKLEVEE